MTLATRLNAGKIVFSAWSAIPDALTVEALTASPFDVITLDMQHGGHHEDSVLHGLVPLISSGKPGLVRIPVGRFDMASKALDFGAQAVIAPMINSLDDTRAFAAAMKYPPLGRRSWGAGFAMSRTGKIDSGQWLVEQNGRTLAFAMIETREALAIVDDILAGPGIDGVFVGPSDFSIAWTDGERVDAAFEEMMDAIAHIGAQARAAGKYAGIYVADPQLAARYAGMGYRLIAFGSEQRFMALGAASLLEKTRACLKKKTMQDGDGYK